MVSSRSRRRAPQVSPGAAPRSPWRVALLFVCAAFFATGPRAEPGAEAPAAAVEHTHLQWLASFHKARFSDLLEGYADVQLRWAGGPTRWSQILIRPGVIFHLHKHAAFTLGGATFWHHNVGADPRDPPPPRREWRPWQQLQVWHGLGDARLYHRARTEQRFQQVMLDGAPSNAWDVGYRGRYQVTGLVPIDGQPIGGGSSLYLVGAQELLVNLNKEVDALSIDQHRVFLGIGAKFTEDVTMQVGYLNLYVHGPPGRRVMQHIARVVFRFDNDLRAGWQ